MARSWVAWPLHRERAVAAQLAADG